ncbi:MAG TPA: hypothetical protein VG736_02455 [Vicinamibacterales bacterium]|jgi:hypothetical protein|nr:hypothetical protein [Vicinamibacterales bacterium]
MRVFALIVTSLLCAPVLAHAQQPTEPIGRFAFDLRGFYSGFGQDPVTAEGLDVQPTDLPSRGFGGVAGIHVYPLRTKGFALGIGAEGILARASKQARDETTGDPTGLPIVQRLMGLSPQISFNFGHRQGWSYLSAGMGPLSFASYQRDMAPDDPAPRKRTINMGAGARWFNTAHLAFCFDMRFYLTRPEDPTITYPGRQRSRLLVLSAGISIK